MDLICARCKAKNTYKTEIYEDDIDTVLGEKMHFKIKKYYCTNKNEQGKECGYFLKCEELE